MPCYNSALTLPRVLEAVSKLYPKPEYYLFAENNSRDNTLDILEEFQIANKEILRVWFRRDATSLVSRPHTILGIVRDLLKTRAKQLDLDYALCLDSDIVLLDRDILPRLIVHKKDVIGVPYRRYFPEPSNICLGTLFDNNTLRKVPRVYGLDEVSATSAGCLMLSKEIIQDENLAFANVWNNNPLWSEDFGFCRQCRDKVYRIYIDSSIKIYHMIDETLVQKPWTLGPSGYTSFSF